MLILTITAITILINFFVVHGFLGRGGNFFNYFEKEQCKCIHESVFKTYCGVYALYIHTHMLLPGRLVHMYLYINFVIDNLDRIIIDKLHLYAKWFLLRSDQ